MTAWHFDPEADDFDARREDLLDEFEAWLNQRSSNDDAAEQRSDAGLFLDWRVNYSSGDLGRLSTADMDEFLLYWCPAKYSAPPSVARPLCSSLEAFVEFLGATAKLDGGVATAAQLIAHISALPDQVETAMGDKTNYGMAKSLFAGADLDQVLNGSSPEDLESLIQQRVEEHNALPIEERRAATDHLIKPEPLELPFVYLPPAADDVEKSAAAAPVMASFEALRDYLGPSGKALTQQRGNLKLADARALIELLNTGDEMDVQIGGKVFKTQSSQDLPGLNLLLEWAISAGAVRRERGKLLPVKRWQQRSATDRAEQCWRYLAKTGPVSARRGFSPFVEYDMLLEDGVQHWLLPLLPIGTALDFDQLVETAREVIAEQLGEPDESWSTVAVDLVERNLSQIFETVEHAGVVCWDGSHQVTDRFQEQHRAGGTLRLTDIGRHLVSAKAEESGYRLRTVPDLGQASAVQLFEFLSTNSADPSEIASRWRPAESAQQRGVLISEVLGGESGAYDRLFGFTLLAELGPAAVAPSVRQLLDGPAAGNAALFLLEHGLAEEEEVGSFVGIGPLVDTLSCSADEPDELCDLWTKSIASGNDADDLLERIWRHPAPETAVVLEALGSTLPDKRQAKSARKALIRHRSWMANQH